MKSYNYVIILLLYLPHLILLAAAAQKKLGDWVQLPAKLGWTVFNQKGQSFDPAINMRYCKQHTIRVAYSAAVSDYSKQINAAFEALSARVPPGGTVKLDAGRYPISAQIVMGSYSCLIGASMNGTIIRLKNNSPKFRLSGMVRSLHTKHVTIKRVTIDGNRKAQYSNNLAYGGYGRYGLFTELTNYLYIKEARTINNLGYGFDPHGSKKYWAYYLLLEDCEAHENGLDGFTLDQTIYVTLRNSRAYANDRHGVNIVTGTRNCRVINTEAKNNGFATNVGCNMMAQNNQQYRTADIAFAGNTLVNGRKAGFCVNDVTKVTLERNLVSNSHNRSYCYYLEQTRRVTMRSMKCRASRGGKNVLRQRKGAQLRFARDASSMNATTLKSTRKSSRA